MRKAQLVVTQIPAAVAYCVTMMMEQADGTLIPAELTNGQYITGGTVGVVTVADILEPFGVKLEDFDDIPGYSSLPDAVAEYFRKRDGKFIDERESLIYFSKMFAVGDDPIPVYDLSAVFWEREAAPKVSRGSGELTSYGIELYFKKELIARYIGNEYADKEHALDSLRFKYRSDPAYITLFCSWLPSLEALRDMQGREFTEDTPLDIVHRTIVEKQLFV